jgi:hypothetical protein
MIPASPADTLGFCTDVPPGGTQGPGGNFHRDAGSPDGVPNCMAGPPVSGKIEVPHAHRRHAMAAFVDGFVVPVPRRNIAAYLRMARLAGKVWREHGEVVRF